MINLTSQFFSHLRSAGVAENIIKDFTVAESEKEELYGEIYGTVDDL